MEDLCGQSVSDDADFTTKTLIRHQKRYNIGFCAAISPVVSLKSLGADKFNCNAW